MQKINKLGNKTAKNIIYFTFKLSLVVTIVQILSMLGRVNFFWHV